MQVWGSEYNPWTEGGTNEVSQCVCVLVCVRERGRDGEREVGEKERKRRERERELFTGNLLLSIHVYVCVYTCI